MLGKNLLAVAAERGDAPALMHEGSPTSYRMLAAEALSWAAVLARSLEPGAADPLAVHLPNSPEYAVLVTALALCGVPLLPVHPQWSPVETARSLGGRRLAGILARQSHLAAWQDCTAFAGVRVLALEKLQAEAAHLGPDRASSWLEADHGGREALYLMTSGTTSQPKLVVRSHANLLANARHVGQVLGWQPGSTVLPVTPFHHANGFSNGLLLPLLRGCCIVIMPQYFPAKLAALIREHKVASLLASPAVYRSLLTCPEAMEAMSGLQDALSSGAPLPDDVAARAASDWGLQVRELYGSSETGTLAIEPRHSAGGRRSAGLPLPGVDLAILSEDGNRLAPGMEGLVGVRSPAVMKGYWTPTGVDPARGPGGWYLTGDIGLLDDRGELHLRGRTRKFINAGGNKIDPCEVEAVLKLLPGLAHVRVSGVPHGQGGELVSARVTLQPGSGLDKAALLAHLRMHLAEYKIPRLLELQEPPQTDIPGKHSLPLQ